jgi:DNA-binding IclR family transcriptional regulator
MDPLRYAEDPRLDSKTRHVLRLLAARAKHDGTVRGGEWIAEAVALGRNSVSRAIAELEVLGFLDASRKPRQANLYTLRPRANTELRAAPHPKESGTACTTEVQRAERAA